MDGYIGNNLNKTLCHCVFHLKSKVESSGTHHMKWMELPIRKILLHIDHSHSKEDCVEHLEPPV